MVVDCCCCWVGCLWFVILACGGYAVGLLWLLLLLVYYRCAFGSYLYFGLVCWLFDCL